LQIPSATEVEFLYQKQLSKGSSGGKQVADASDQSKKALTGGQRKTKGLLKGK
jgi:hypothetical protein